VANAAVEIRHKANVILFLNIVFHIGRYKVGTVIDDPPTMGFMQSNIAKIYYSLTQSLSEMMKGEKMVSMFILFTLSNQLKFMYTHSI